MTIFRTIHKPATPQRTFARTGRTVAIAACMFCTIVAQVASAECSPKARALGKCPPPPRHELTATSNMAGSVPVRHAGSDPYVRPHPMAQDHTKVKPAIGPGPVAHAGATTGSHGIIFVGGHAQQTQAGAKQSLNPQPIPPGHQAQVPIGPHPATLAKPKVHGSQPSH